MYQPKKPVTSADHIQETLGPMYPTQIGKVIDHIDIHCANWIARSPFVSIATCNASGHMDVSPKGDPPGFVKVLDPKTLLIPDRIGNNRADTFFNILENPRIGLMFVVPKRKEVVRINGSAQVVEDDELLDLTVVNNHRPTLAILVRVEEAFFHCGKSMIRSRMWQPDMWGPVEGLATYAEALKDHADMPDPIEEIEKRTVFIETERLY